MAKEPTRAKEPKAAAKPKTSAAKKAATKETGNVGGRTDGAHKTVQPSPQLAAVVGKEPLKRTEVVKKVWDYIKSKDLQNPKDKREILADDNLEKVFGRKKVTMFEMNKYLNQHLS